MQNVSRRIIFILTMMWLMAAPVFAAVHQNPLPADKAFIFSVSVENRDKINVHWQIAKDYYLYSQKMHFKLQPDLNADILLPKSLKHHQYEIYSGDVTVPITLQTNAKAVQLKVDYQGCSDKGFCYPPIHQSMTLDMVNKSVSPTDINKPLPQTFQSLLTDQNGVKELFDSQHLGMMLLIFAGLGLLLAFTPCVLPMIPILTSIIVGHKQPVTSGKAFLLSSTYVLGSALTYAAAGMTAAYMGGSLQALLQQPWIIAVVSGLFALLSLSLFGVYDLRLPGYWQNRITSLSRKQQSGTYVGVFIMGIVSTLIVSPCVTAPLVGVLMYIAQSGNMALGAGALFMMGIGMGIPLILIGMTAGKWFPKRGPWMIIVQKIFGLMMLGMAFWLLSRVFSLTAIMSFCAVLLLGAAIFFGLYRPHLGEGKLSFNRGLAAIMCTVGVLLMVGINILPKANTPSLSPSSFIIVHNMEDLKNQLAIAQASGKPVLLDFYADWCESCIAMDKKVFKAQDVLSSMDNFVLLRADLSDNSAADEELLRQYEVIAPPTVLFFNDHGREVNSHRIIGELNAKEFITRINTFMTASCDTKMPLKHMQLFYVGCIE